MLNLYELCYPCNATVFQVRLCLFLRYIVLENFLQTSGQFFCPAKLQHDQLEQEITGCYKLEKKKIVRNEQMEFLIRRLVSSGA